MDKPKLPPGWVWTTLDDSCEVIMGQSPPSSTYNTEGYGLPFYQGKAEFGDLYPSPVKWCSEPNKIAEANDILISVRAPVGPTNLCREQSCIGRGLAAVRPLENLEYRYFLHWLRYIEDDWESKSTGTTFKAISGSTLRAQELPLPPLPEQQRIVDEIEAQFTRLDAVAAALKRAQATLKRCRASVLKIACEGRLVPQNPSDEPAGQLLERILAERRQKWNGRGPYTEPSPPDTSDLPELPVGWVWASVEQLGYVIGGLTKNANRKVFPLKLPYLRVANVYSNELRLDDIQEIGVLENELERITLKKGDLLVVEGNGSIDQIGRVAIWDGSISPCVHQNHIIKVRFEPVELAKYILFWLLSNNGRDQIMHVASSTSGLHTLSLSKVAALAIPLPPLTEQQRIVEEVERRLSVLDEVEAALQANLKRAERLRQAILKRAFAGKLVPQNPADEPASVLLARIRAAKLGLKAGLSLLSGHSTPLNPPCQGGRGRWGCGE